VEEVGGWQRWTSVDGFYASGPDARHYVVDLEAGDVLFGNGIQGLAPQLGQRIRAVEYRFGGGAEGNVPPKAISKLLIPSPGEVQIPPDVFARLQAHPPKVTNPLRAYGGGAAEAVQAALDRIPGELRRRDRAVTVTDFQELALMTPGANVGRAECLPRFHAPSRTPERAGIVSVVVWPQEDPQHPNAPLPDRNLLRSVCTWLDARRLVTTELYVIPPTYRKVAVSIGLRVKPGYGVEAVRRWVELVIRQYLAPLPPYGPAGGGWPLGRRVHGPELEAAALQVEGVEFLEGLTVAGFDEQQQGWVPGSVNLAVYEVPELAEITVVEGPDIPEPGQVVGPPPSPGVPVPIPILREEC
jgi:predicted phage baseplate assembly protein